ncbi:MAG TPA: 3-hydroxyacyl-CoA dehydrogenase NAD-binding domain-containing protein [Dongiaceae bacterium]|nr:3-hydroxyacyl-CoA dehydrogenase NAD-binding domain-containing protein [Dongiaceae bacterium]
MSATEPQRAPWAAPDPAKEPAHALVIGAGAMGAGIAMVFAAAHWRVSVIDPSDRARGNLVRTMAESMARLGQTLNSDLVSTHDRIEAADWSSVAIAIESAVEDLDVKRRCFAEMQRVAPAGIPLASNSTGYPIGAIAEGLEGRDRMVGIHFLMPAQFVPLVEIIPGAETAAALVPALQALLRALGKRPVLVRKPIIGFLANRMQSALMREALSLIDRGLATPEDVDTAVRFGFGFRYAAAGPIVQKEHSGWEISYSLYQKVFPDLCNDAAPSAQLERMIADGHFGMKSGRGFFAWDEDSIAAEKQRYETALQDALTILKR